MDAFVCLAYCSGRFVSAADFPCVHIFAGDRLDKTCEHELQMLSFLFSQPGAPGAVSKDYGTAHAHSRPGGRLSSTTPATQDMVAPHKIQEPVIQGSPTNDHYQG